MSARALTWCWTVRPRTATQKLVLAALADRADDDGECFPSIGWLAVKCAPASEQAVKRALSELADQGLVEKTERRRRGDGTLGTWLMRLPLDRQGSPMTAGVPTAAAADADATDHQRSVGHRSPATKPGVTGDTAEPSIETTKSSTDVEDAGTRPRDPVWDSLVEWVGYTPTSKTETKGWGKVVRDLKEAGATGETIKAACAAYSKEWPEMERSPYAIEKWWGRFLQAGSGSNIRAAVLSWARNVGVHLEGHGLDDELLSWATRGADDATLAEAKRIAGTPIEKLAAATA